tara:strand:+ start:5764 stop:6603 length:840 start_codon:yes stop_codon:yes gene_type:complete
MLGLLVGSFLNVLIARLPANESIVSPGSRCPNCANSIRFYDNIPIFSWLVLRGRCRKCEWEIPIRYPVIEAMCAVAFLLVFFRARHLAGSPDLMGWYLLHGLSFMALLLAISVIDLDHMIIPDGLSLTGTLFGLAISFGAVEATGINWQYSSVGALVGGGTVLFVAISYRIVRGRDGMGMGDVKLMALLGAYLGFASVPFILFAASVQGTLFATLWWLTSRPNQKTTDGSADMAGVVVAEEQESVGMLALPFGPFLALSGMQWYLLHDVLPQNPLIMNL